MVNSYQLQPAEAAWPHRNFLAISRRVRLAGHRPGTRCRPDCWRRGRGARGHISCGGQCGGGAGRQPSYIWACPSGWSGRASRGLCAHAPPGKGILVGGAAAPQLAILNNKDTDSGGSDDGGALDPNDIDIAYFVLLILLSDHQRHLRQRGSQRKYCKSPHLGKPIAPERHSQFSPSLPQLSPAAVPLGPIQTHMRKHVGEVSQTGASRRRAGRRDQETGNSYQHSSESPKSMSAPVRPNFRVNKAAHRGFSRNEPWDETFLFLCGVQVKSA